MRHAGVRAKIWLSVGVVLLGYVISVGLTYTQSAGLGGQLNQVADGLVPVAQKMQASQAAFLRMSKAQRDAVLTEDTANLEQSFQEGEGVVRELRGVAGLPGLQAERARTVSELALALEQLNSLAGTTYRGALAAKGNLTPALQSDLRQVTEQSERIKGELPKFVELTSADLRNELNRATSQLALQSKIDIAVFL